MAEWSEVPPLGPRASAKLRKHHICRIAAIALLHSLCAVHPRSRCSTHCTSRDTANAGFREVCCAPFWAAMTHVCATNAAQSVGGNRGYR